MAKKQYLTAHNCHDDVSIPSSLARWHVSNLNHPLISFRFLLLVLATTWASESEFFFFFL